MFHVEHCTYNSGRVAGRQFIVAASTSELEPPRSTVYKDLGSTMPGAVLPACAMQTAMFPQTACKRLISKRKWWNWQTHHLEGVAPKGVGVQIPPSALKSISCRPFEGTSQSAW